jgi:hypothetical protein
MPLDSTLKKEASIGRREGNSIVLTRLVGTVLYARGRYSREGRL